MICGNSKKDRQNYKKMMYTWTEKILAAQKDTEPYISDHEEIFCSVSVHLFWKDGIH
jgi:hypothetical protein